MSATVGPTVAVIGAFGMTGRQLIPVLEMRGVRVRAIGRKMAPANMFSASVEVRAGNLEDVESLASAIKGADSIHYIPPSFNALEEQFARNLIAAAERTGISRLVYHSVLHAATPDMPHHIRKASVELSLRHSNLSWTVLQPAMYSQTVLAFFDQAAGVLSPAFDPSRPFTPVDGQDLAEVAAIMHTTDGHAYATYELAGSEQLDFFEMGERLGEVLGRSIETRAQTQEAVGERLSNTRGYTPEQVRELALMCAHYDKYGLVGNANVLRMLLGRESTNFSEAIRRSPFLVAYRAESVSL
jgi:NAD(P)H dehydrogenase (quinone)